MHLRVQFQLRICIWKWQCNDTENLVNAASIRTKLASARHGKHLAQSTHAFTNSAKIVFFPQFFTLSVKTLIVLSQPQPTHYHSAEHIKRQQRNSGLTCTACYHHTFSPILQNYNFQEQLYIYSEYFANLPQLKQNLPHTFTILSPEYQNTSVNRQIWPEKISRNHHTFSPFLQKIVFDHIFKLLAKNFVSRPTASINTGVAQSLSIILRSVSKHKSKG